MALGGEKKRVGFSLGPDPLTWGCKGVFCLPSLLSAGAAGHSCVVSLQLQTCPVWGWWLTVLVHLDGGRVGASHHTLSKWAAFMSSGT